MSEIVNCISEASAPLSLRLRWSSLFFATACVITMLIVAVCASVGCFQCLCLACLTEPRWERKRKRASERGWETSEQCAERVFFFFGTVCALFRPEGQLSDPDPQRNSWGSSTVFVCGCWGMDVFSLHLTVKHAFTYIHTFSLFCVSARLWSSILSSRDMKGWLRRCTLKRWTRTVPPALVVDELPSFESVWLVQQGTRLRPAGVSRQLRFVFITNRIICCRKN